MFNTISGTFDIDKSGSYILAVFKWMIHLPESKIFQSVGPAGRLPNSTRTQMRCANNDSSSGFSGLFNALIPFLSEPSLFMNPQTRLIYHRKLALFIIVVSVIKIAGQSRSSRRERDNYSPHDFSFDSIFLCCTIYCT